MGLQLMAMMLEGLKNPSDAMMHRALVAGGKTLGLKLGPETYDRCVRHWRLVQSYNLRTNLTAIASDTDAVFSHYLDSLAGANLLREGSVVDFGSGAGFPGIPLAIARPELSFVLVEPRRKRASFLRFALSNLALQNVQVCEARLQDPAPAAFAQAVTRATFSDVKVLEDVRRWLREDGCLWVWRARDSLAASFEAKQTILRHSYRTGEYVRHIEQWTWPPSRV